MQGTWAARLKTILKFAIPILVVGLCVLFDQVTKNYFKTEYARGQRVFIIKDFFFFTYTINTGAAWSFLADKAWGQIFLKILTGIALVGFAFYFGYALKKNLYWLSYSLALIIGGTIGNFIDRIAFNGVTDFIGFLFGGYTFPIFNLADSFLVVGLIMLIFYYAFLDSNAIFKKHTKDESKTPSNIESESVDDDKEISDN